MTNKSTEFRNDITHKDYIPTFDEVVKIGQTVADYIVNIQKDIIQKYEAKYYLYTSVINLIDEPAEAIEIRTIFCHVGYITSHGIKSIHSRSSFKDYILNERKYKQPKF